MARNGRDELAARRSERIIEQARLAMVAAGEPAARVARANASVAKARRKLEKGARELLAEGYARGVPGLCPAPEEDRPACRRVVAEGAGLCPKHLAEAERIERRLAAAERKAAREAARSAAEARRKPPGAKVPAEGAAGRQRPEKAKAKTGRPGHSEPFRPFPGQCSGWVSSKDRQCRQSSDGPDGFCVHHRPKA